jgi:5-methylcytosine-specific restriction endonuclease McrA
MKEFRIRRQQEDRCMTCGKSDLVTYGKQKTCYVCYFKQTAHKNLGTRKRWKELRDLWERQKGICPYTGTALQIGVDASIDHILPKSRYPELRYEISNLEWVSTRINVMKRDMTKDEFTALIKQMAANL